MANRGVATGRVLGLVSSAGSAVLWVVFLTNPYRGQGATTGTWLIAFLMIGLAVWGVAAAIKARALWLAIAAVVSLVPIGLYMAMTPGVFKWIGLFNALMLVAAIIIGLANYSGTCGPRRSRA
jgi:Na+-translocating ferredoxin:NAD+ oxidoreductase RnfE subunit